MSKSSKSSAFLKELENYRPSRSSFGVGLNTPKTSFANKDKEKNNDDLDSTYGISGLGTRWSGYRNYLLSFGCGIAVKKAEKFYSGLGIYERKGGKGRLVVAAGTDLSVWLMLTLTNYWNQFTDAVRNQGKMKPDQAELFISKIAQTIKVITGINAGSESYLDTVIKMMK